LFLGSLWGVEVFSSDPPCLPLAFFLVGRSPGAFFSLPQDHFLADARQQAAPSQTPALNGPLFISLNFLHRVFHQAAFPFFQKQFYKTFPAVHVLFSIGSVLFFSRHRFFLLVFTPQFFPLKGLFPLFEMDPFPHLISSCAIWCRLLRPSRYLRKGF